MVSSNSFDSSGRKKNRVKNAAYPNQNEMYDKEKTSSLETALKNILNHGNNPDNNETI